MYDAFGRNVKVNNLEVSNPVNRQGFPHYTAHEEQQAVGEGKICGNQIDIAY